MRRTHAVVAVAAALLAEADARHWGYELSKRSGVRSGVMYPLLTRLMNEGWLVDGWEDEAETGGKRPPRRYYGLTDVGLRELGAILRSAQADERFRRTSIGWAT